ncbi:MAG: hypothetical protein ACI8T1_002056 [Verrucomicrobiales bacterium]|jgi:hypothetical protein
MSRRSRSSKKGFSPLIPSIILLVVLGAGFFAFKQFGGGKDAFHGLTQLNVAEYMENSKSLQGNVYKVEGRVEDKLGWSPNGRALMVVSEGSSPVALKVPASFNDQNIQLGQIFAFKVRVVRYGFLIVEDLKKV